MQDLEIPEEWVKAVNALLRVRELKPLNKMNFITTLSALVEADPKKWLLFIKPEDIIEAADTVLRQSGTSVHYWNPNKPELSCDLVLEEAKVSDSLMAVNCSRCIRRINHHLSQCPDSARVEQLERALNLATARRPLTVEEVGEVTWARWQVRVTNLHAAEEETARQWAREMLARMEST